MSRKGNRGEHWCFAKKKVENAGQKDVEKGKKIGEKMKGEKSRKAKRWENENRWKDNRTYKNVLSYS